MDTSSEIVLLPYQTFTSCPPVEFKISSKGGLRPPENSRVTVISDLKKDLSNTSSTTTIHSLVELEEFRHQIYGKPLISFIHCGKHVPYGQRLNNRGNYLGPRDLEWWLIPERTPWRDPYVSYGTGTTSLYSERFLRTEFMVSIDTAHANIRAFLDSGFQQAENYLINGERFSLEFDFNPVLKNWWRKQGPSRWDSLECLEITATVGARFTITNYSPVNHVFDCHALWFACWPFYCVSALPYKFGRNVINRVRDITEKLDSGQITVSRPNQSGYSLRELHSRGAVTDSQPDRGTGVNQATPMLYSQTLLPFNQYNAFDN